MKSETLLTHEHVRQETMRIVLSDIANPWRLDEIAELLNVSRRSIQRAFEVVEESFVSVVAAVRMDKAALLLLSDDSLSVRTVSHRVGYNQPAHFAKAFRRHHGVPPSKYRQKVDLPA